MRFIDRATLEVEIHSNQVEAIKRFELDGREPVGPRVAATVMLMRRAASASGLEVYMLKRSKSMAFLPNVLVFPGGGVDATDALYEYRWEGPSPDEWSVILGMSTRDAKALVVAAVRELFEEAGVLLAGDLVSPLPEADSLDDERTLLEGHQLALEDILARRNLALRTDCLYVRDQWVTPEFSSRRYRAFFFSAMLPHNQQAYSHSTEAQRAVWVDPSEALEEQRRNQSLVAPPTAFNLLRLAEAAGEDAFQVHIDCQPAHMFHPVFAQEGRMVMRCEVCR
ncbi:NUDIX domain-containing protein [Berryella wangjianweii]|uniref:NUDIX domain-containing protein n=1 Tax=Berryella wangjianweii TaxID=2734634 RepID=A0A6M8J1M3_9ACTN|nr:NUDIX domain-containing protein [Berryella wangjianweii]QKF07840.1 NUDIX domain-containing protein [Berryella wangjianweii]